MWSLTWAYGLAARGEPVVLISLDTDARTQAARLACLHAGGRVTLDEVLAEPDLWAAVLDAAELPIRVIDRPVTASEVGEIIRAYREWWGRPPALVVLDDVSKLRMEQRDYQGFDASLVELHMVARAEDTVILGLHHLHRGQSSNREQPIRLSDGKYVGEYEAEVVYGLWRPNARRLRVSIVKNRFGDDDPSGRLYVELYADPARVSIRDLDYWDVARETVGVAGEEG